VTAYLYRDESGILHFSENELDLETTFSTWTLLGTVTLDVTAP
jgi:hypothetical protein